MRGRAITSFKLSVTRALRDQLMECLDGLTPTGLDTAAIDAVETRGGVYILYLDGERKYVGKAAKSLRTRLRNHHKKLSGRNGIDMTNAAFIAAYVDEDLDAVAPETLLIKELRLPWNFNGFGNKDPGRNRDNTRIKRTHFDAAFPIRLDYVLPDRNSWGSNLGGFLDYLKKSLPFNLRYEESQQFEGLTPPQIRAGTTAEEAFVSVVSCLPSAWQLTALPGYVILYKEQVDYPSAMCCWRQSLTGQVERVEGKQQFAEDDGETEAQTEELAGEEQDGEDTETE